MKNQLKQNLLIFLLVLFSSVLTYGQNSAVTNAILYHKDGELDKAKENIDAASAHEKTSALSKTLYYKGVIYSDIAHSTNPTYQSLSKEPLKIAYESLLKAQELDLKKGEYYKLSGQKLEELWGAFINKASEQYEASDYTSALANFEYAQKIKPTDTTAFVYGLYAAEEAGNNQKINEFVSKLISLNYKSSYLYLIQIHNAATVDKDINKAIEISKKAKADFPSDKNILHEQTNLYLQSGKTEEAIQNLQTLIQFEPTNTSYLTQLASLFDQKKETDKALEVYEKVLKIDSENFVSNFNVAVIYYDKGKALNEKVHSLTVDAYHKEGKKMEEEVNSLFSKSLSHAEVALKKSKDQTDTDNISILIRELKKALNK